MAFVLASLLSISVSHADVTDYMGGSDTDSNNDGLPDTDVDYPSWIFLSLPGYGIASLQNVATDGTPAREAFIDIGEPLSSYVPTPVFASFQSAADGAIAIFMLPERCLGDFNNDGVVNLYDAPLFVDAYLSMDLSADLSRDGRIDARDHMTFMLLLTMPCVSAWGI